MIINPKIEEVLQEFGIPREDGISYLLSIYFDVRPSYTPRLLIQRMNITNILTLDENKLLAWRIPLFQIDETNDTKWSWVEDWMDSFKAVNKDRRGTKSSVYKYMKEFFSQNPDVRKDEVIGATNMYFKNLDNSKYCKKSHKFIYEGAGKFRVSLLEEWIEKYRLVYQELPEQQGNSNPSLNNQMQ